MNQTEAFEIISTLCEGYPEGDPSEEDIVRAASVLHQSGMTGTLPGRYGRTVRDIFEAVLAGDIACPADVTITRRAS